MTAHDPRVTLTEEEVERLRVGIRLAVRFGRIGPNSAEIIARGGTVCLTPQESDEAADRLAEDVADLIAARLAPIRALAEEWEAAGFEIEPAQLRNALDAPQDAPRGPVGGEQGAEVAGGHGDGERAGEGDYGTCCNCMTVRQFAPITFPESWALPCGCTFDRDGTQITTHKCCTTPEHQGEEAQR